MKKTTALKIVNPIIGILFVVQAASGMFHELIPYEVFSTIHVPVGLLLTLSVVLHVYLNWTWIVTTFFVKNEHKKYLYSYFTK